MSKKSTFYIIAFIGLSILFSCGSKAEKNASIRKFYFPYQDLFTPQVYKYRDLNNPEKIQYWHIKSKISHGDTIMTTTTYNENFDVIEIFKEIIKPTGPEILSYTMINDLKITNTKAEAKEIYYWQQPFEQEITWSIIYRSRFGKEKLEKRRKLVGTNENKTFQNKSYPCAKFKDDYTQSATKDDWSDQYTFYQYSYYAEGIGLIEYKRFFDNGSEINYVLENIFTEEEWKELR